MKMGIDDERAQLSAMFDGELSAAECELLARRLTRDEALRAQWSRFAVIGAALRAERGVKLHDRVAWRGAVRGCPGTQLWRFRRGRCRCEFDSFQRPGTRPLPRPARAERWMRFARPVMGASIAAGVAAVSILWLRTQGPEPALVASAPASESIVLTPEVTRTPVTAAATQPEPRPRSNGEPERIYSTPAPSSQTSIAPPARFANYVVAHSEYSGPLARRMALLGIVGTEAAADEAAEAGHQPLLPAPGEAGAVDNAP